MVRDTGNRNGQGAGPDEGQDPDEFEEVGEAEEVDDTEVMEEVTEADDAEVVEEPEAGEEDVPSLKSGAKKDKARILGIGKGDVNGRGRRRDKGLTNGLTNGPGLTNGRGLINGRSITNGRGLVNGGTGPAPLQPHDKLKRELGASKGLINGESLVNGRGLINGRGLVNGKSLTNGKKFAYAEKVPERTKTKWKVVAAITVVMVIIVVLFPILYSITIDKGIHVDGFFEDWDFKKMRRYQDDDKGHSVDNPNVNIAFYATDKTGDDLSAYVEYEGQAFGGADYGVDFLYMFVDVDNDASTGYYFENSGGIVGAEYMGMAYGWDGLVQSTGFYKYAGNEAADGKKYEWEWDSISNMRVAARDNKVEAQVWFKAMGSPSMGHLAILLHTEDSFDRYDDSSCTNPSVPTIQVWQDIEATSARLTFTVPRHDTVKGEQFTNISVSSANFAKMGTGSGSISGDHAVSGTTAILNMEVEGSAESASFGVSAYSGSYGVRIENPRDVSAVYETDYENGHIWSDNNAIVSVQTGARRMAGASTGQISIDGSFVDWGAVNQATDNSGDVDKNDWRVKKASNPGDSALNIQPKNVDITRYATATGDSTLFFYLRVANDMMSGMTSSGYSMRPSPGPGGAPGKEDEDKGLDVAYMFIDSDNDDMTGYQAGDKNDFPLGAEYMIKIAGSHGIILKQELSKYKGAHGGGWDWDEAGSVSAAADQSQLEVGVNAGVAGVSGEYKAFFYMVGWNGFTDHSDRASAGSRELGGGGDHVGKVTIKQYTSGSESLVTGANDQEVLTVLVRSPTTIGLESITVERSGDVADSDIGYVRARLDDGDGVFSETDDAMFGEATRLENGKATFALDQPLGVEWATLFFSVDILQRAEKGESFKMGLDLDAKDQGISMAGLEEYGLAKKVVDTDEFVYETYITASARSRWTGTVVINEMKVGSSSTISWIEIWNYGSSSVDISGWLLRNFNGDEVTTFYTFPGSTSIGANSYTVISSGSFGYSINTTDVVQLKSGSTLKDNWDVSTACGSIGSGSSCSRYRTSDGSAPSSSPQFYTNSSPSSGGGEANQAIPEFQDIIIPVCGMMAAFIIVRRLGHGKRRSKDQ